MTVRQRQDVLRLATWDSTLLWYAKAVAAMRQRPATDPTSWNYQAAMHGFNAQLAAWQGIGPLPPAGDRAEYWNQCQHGSWYFLPWHRMYLAYFEQIVATAIADLGGPADWALPFWNYSDTSHPDARALPAAFAATGTPFSPNSNPLHMPGRVLGSPGHATMPARDVGLGALAQASYVADVHGGSPGFGGPRTAFSHAGGQHGALEHQPHDLVHVDVAGVMADPRTAALDPIFWLHHANIDRLWEVWLRATPSHTNPTDTPWLNLTFQFHAKGGVPAALKASQVLDTTKVLSGYTYEGLPSVAAHAPAPVSPALAAAASAPVPMTPSTPPELLAATSQPQVLGSTSHTVQLAIEAARGPLSARLRGVEALAAASAGPPPADAFLNFENITGTGVPPVFDVYLNLPPGADPAAHEELYAGPLPLFGVASASEADDRHSGSGMHYVLQITELLDTLRKRPDWQDRQLQVTLVPRSALDADASVTVGRVSLYAKEAPRRR